MKNTKTIRGDFLIIFAMGLFGSYSLFLRLIPDISTLTFVFVFQVVGAIAFLLTSVRKGLPRLNASSYLMLLALAFVAVANDVLYFAAFRNTTVANATMAHQSVSIFMLLLAPLLLGEKTERSEWLSLIPALAGIAIIYSSSANFDANKDILGITLGLLAGLFYALLIILYRLIPARKGVEVGIINLYRYLFSIILLLPFISLFNVEAIEQKDIVPLLFFGLVFAFIASGIHSIGLSRARSLHSSILGKTEPVFATLYAALFLGESPSASTMVGGLLIIGASIWLAFRKENQISPAETILST